MTRPRICDALSRLEIQPRRRDLAIIISGSALSAVCAASMLYAVAQVSTNGGMPVVQAAIFIGSFGLFMLATIVTSRVQADMEAMLAESVRLSLVRRILATRFELLRNKGSHDLYNVITTDVGQITRGLAILPSFALNLAKIGACALIIAIISPLLFLILIVPIALMLGLTNWLATHAFRHGEAVRTGMSRTLAGFKATVEGARELAADAELRRAHYHEMEADAAWLRDVSCRAGRTWGWNRVVTWGGLFGILGLTAILGARLDSSDRVTTVILLATYCISAYEVIIQGIQMISSALNSAVRIDSLDLARDPHRVEFSSAAAQYTNLEWETLEMVDLSYRFPALVAEHGSSDAYVVGPIRFSVKRGEVVFITGGNGSGKTTLFHLLLGLLGPSEGSVHLDDQSWLDTGIRRWQSTFAVVHADFHLFPYVMGRDGGMPDRDLIGDLLALLKLEGIVAVEGGRFTTTGLSRGQRKRLALLAAIASDRDIYLLDEWAADQDPEFRRVFYEVVIPRLRSNGKTVIAITHDDSYFHAADRVVALKRGSDPLPRSHPSDTNANKMKESA